MKLTLNLSPHLTDGLDAKAPWSVLLGRCPRARNHKIWRCNSYRP